MTALGVAVDNDRSLAKIFPLYAGNPEDLLKIAQSPVAIPFLITGPTGAGKTRTAAKLHNLSNRAGKAFIKVACPNLPAELVESILFGHVKGAFTGASQDKAGLVAAADGGTLFLDEIAEIPIETQAKLLDFLESGQYYKLGSRKLEHADVRVIAATNRDIKNSIAEGRLRSDIYYRLNGFPAEFLSLNERPEVIPEIALDIMKNLSEKHKTEKTLSDFALDKLKSVYWAGNVRELEKQLLLAFALSGEEKLIGPEHFRLSGQKAEIALEEVMEKTIKQGFGSGRDLGELFEKVAIIAALKETNGSVTNAAKLIGLTFRTVQNRMIKYGLDKEDYKLQLNAE